MKLAKCILINLLWFILTAAAVFAAIWFGTGEDTWEAGEVQGHQVEQYFKDLAKE